MRLRLDVLLTSVAVGFILASLFSLAWLVLKEPPLCDEPESDLCMARLAAETQMAVLVQRTAIGLAVVGSLLGLAAREARRR